MNTTQFWARIDQSGGPSACWPWDRPSPNGYGRLALDGVMGGAHRFAYLLGVGPIPDGLQVLHRCDNPPCCNPAHLYVGTQAENLADMLAKGRGAVGDRNGARTHPETRARGERVGGSKLTAEDVAFVAARHRDGESNRSIARQLGVAGSSVDRIVNGRTWRHVTATGAP